MYAGTCPSDTHPAVESVRHEDRQQLNSGPNSLSVWARPTITTTFCSGRLVLKWTPVRLPRLSAHPPHPCDHHPSGRTVSWRMSWALLLVSVESVDQDREERFVDKGLSGFFLGPTVQLHLLAGCRS